MSKEEEEEEEEEEEDFGLFPEDMQAFWAYVRRQRKKDEYSLWGEINEEEERDPKVEARVKSVTDNLIADAIRQETEACGGEKPSKEQVMKRIMQTAMGYDIRTLLGETPDDTETETLIPKQQQHGTSI